MKKQCFIIAMMLMLAAGGMLFAGAQKEDKAAQPAQAAPAAQPAPAAEKKASSGPVLNVTGIKARPHDPFNTNYQDLESKLGMKINVNTFPHAELYAREMAELVGQTGAFDVTSGMQLANTMYEPYAIPLDSYIIRDFGSVEKFTSLFNEKAISRGIMKGKVKFVPYQTNSQFLVYRKSLFEDPKEKAAFKQKYGYDLAPPKTLDQVADVAKFFTRPEKNMWGMVFMGASIPGGWTMLSTFFGAGLKMVDPETGKPEFMSGPARERAVKAAKFWYDLIWTHKVAPTGQSAIGNTECYEMYASGKAAMSYGWWGDYWDRVSSKKIIEDIGESGSSPMPTVVPGEGLFMNAWYYGISKTAKNPEAAWGWIKAIALGKDRQLAASQSAGACSPVKEFADIAVKNGWVAPANWETLKKAEQPVNYVQSYALCNVYWTYAPALYAGTLTPEKFIDTLVEKTLEVTQ